MASHTDRMPASVYIFLISQNHSLCDVTFWRSMRYCFDMPVIISISIRIPSTVNASLFTQVYANVAIIDVNNPVFIATIVHVVSGMFIVIGIYYEHYMCSGKKAKFIYKKSPFLGIIIYNFSVLDHTHLHTNFNVF